MDALELLIQEMGERVGDDGLVIVSRGFYKDGMRR
jgi:hypothetical protein